MLKSSCILPEGKRFTVICRSSKFKHLSRRSLSVASPLLLVPFLASTSVSHAEDGISTTVSSSQSEEELLAVTDRVFIQIGLCAEAVRNNRNLGDKSILCSDPEPLGRVILGLYGNAAPNTVNNFKALISAGSLNGTCLSKIFPGQWIIAGQQGSHRSGLVEAPETIQSNPDILSASAFKLRHIKPGTLSLNLQFNEDEDYIRFRKDYRPLSFLITTGPAPQPALDGENIVFGIVQESSLDVISSITRVPIFLPNKSLQGYNALGSLLGDERAERTRAKWNKPLKAVVITESGLL